MLVGDVEEILKSESKKNSQSLKRIRDNSNKFTKKLKDILSLL